MRQAALGGLFLGSLAILVACLVGGPVMEWVFAGAVVLFPAALLALGMGGCGRGIVARTLPPILAGVLLAGTLGILLLSRSGEPPHATSGLSPTTWLMLIGLGAAPFLLTSVGLALDSEDDEPPSAAGRAERDQRR